MGGWEGGESGDESVQEIEQDYCGVSADVVSTVEGSALGRARGGS